MSDLYLAGYHQQVVDMWSNFVHMYDVHLLIFKWIHGHEYDSSKSVCEANSHPGKNVGHGTNACKRPNKAKKDIQSIEHLTCQAAFCQKASCFGHLLCNIWQRDTSTSPL